MKPKRKNIFKVGFYYYFNVYSFFYAVSAEGAIDVIACTSDMSASSPLHSGLMGLVVNTIKIKFFVLYFKFTVSDNGLHSQNYITCGI